MSHAPDSTAHPRAENDHVNSRAVVLVGVGALVIFTGAALAASAYLRLKSGEHPALPLPAEIGDSKIGLVEQQPFNGRLRGARDHDVRRARLAGFGWVDEKAGLVHIPVERAMELVLAGVRAAPAHEPDAPPLGTERGGQDAPSVPIAAPPPPAPLKGGKRP
jgi:hypothetical protein